MERPAVVPLSFAQRRLWFLNRLEGRSGAYNVALVVRLAGELDVGALEAALGDVVGRHEVLRTVFAERDGVPFQGWWRAGAGAGLLVAGGGGMRGRWRRRRRRAAFDLARELPGRARLARGSAESRCCCWWCTISRCDGWSWGRCARDLSAAYAARVGGGEPAWQALPVQYADYALWQREVLGGRMIRGV